jgi:hypothetical protein
MEKEELLNGLRAKFSASRHGFIDAMRTHLTEEAMTKSPSVDPDMATIKIHITLTPGHGGYALTVTGEPEDGVQADTIIDACYRSARFLERLQFLEEFREAFGPRKADAEARP